jgi:hypothetical protein
MSDRTETELEIARRHVREGEDRVARQAAIVAELERDSHLAAAAHGRELLKNMLSILDFEKQHLPEIEKQNLGQSPQPTQENEMANPLGLSERARLVEYRYEASPSGGVATFRWSDDSETTHQVASQTEALEMLAEIGGNGWTKPNWDSRHLNLGQRGSDQDST